jgi:hypothetical protein
LSNGTPVRATCALLQKLNGTGSWPVIGLATDVHQRVGASLGFVVDVLAGEGQVELVVGREAQCGARARDVLSTLRSDLATGTAVAGAGRDGEGVVGRATGRDDVGCGIGIGPSAANPSP